MQARPKTLAIFWIVLVAGLLLSACGGGTTGSTWFNVPSLPVRLQEDGSATVYGFNLGPVVDPAMVSQLEAADVDKLDVRIGYEGVQPLLNGATLPYLSWNAESVNELQGVIRSTPNIPNANTIARALPMLRTFGTGVALHLPGGGSVPAWNGEETVIQPEAAEAEVGPINIGGVAFDEQGNASFQGVPLAELGAPVTLPANILSMVQTLGADRITVDTSPNGINLSLDGRPLPGVAYDGETLDRALGVAGAFVDDATQATLDQVAPLLKASDINLDVSFTGEPVGETQIGDVPLEVQPDGNIAVFGIPVTTSPVLDAATLAQLQDANIQQLDVQVGKNGLNLAANGMKLPSIAWTEESLATLANTVGGLAGIAPETLQGGLAILRNTDLGTSITLPPADGAAAVEVPDEVDFTYNPPELGDLNPPLVKLNAALNSDGSIAEAAGLDAATLAALGLSGPVVPANIMAILDSLDASEIRLVGEPNLLKLYLDGSEALAVEHDEESLAAALDLATPFLGDSPLSDPTLNEFLRTVVLPLVPATNLDVTVNMP